MAESLTTLSDRIKIVLMMMNDWPGEFQTLLAGWLGGGAGLTVPSLGRCLHLFTLLSSKNKVMKPADAVTVNKAGSL